jgi:hypothetical protein
VRRVARTIGKRPWMFRLPVFVHILLSWCFERTMAIPLIALSQVRMLAEGLVAPAPGVEPLPEELSPRLRLSEEQIRRGLPEAGPFGLQDLRCR